LFSEELGIVKPDAGHRFHVSECLLVEAVDHLEVGSLLNQIKLFDVESRLFEKIEPKLVATRQMGQSSLINRCALLISIDWDRKYRVPPASEAVSVLHSAHDITVIKLIWCLE